MRVLDPRDTIPGERLEEVSNGDGVARCHTIFNCIDACPKHLDPTRAIETLRSLSTKRRTFEEKRMERQKTLHSCSCRRWNKIAIYVLHHLGVNYV